MTTAAIQSLFIPHCTCGHALVDHMAPEEHCFECTGDDLDYDPVTGAPIGILEEINAQSLVLVAKVRASGGGPGIPGKCLKFVQDSDATIVAEIMES